MGRFWFAALAAVVSGGTGVVVAAPSMTARATVNGQADAPTLFAPAVISTGDFEFRLTLSADGQLAVFSRGTPAHMGWPAFYWIMFSEQSGDNWGEPKVAPFSGRWRDADPIFSQDGRYLYFSSERPLSEGGVTPGGLKLWRVRREALGWGKPEPVPGPVNAMGSIYGSTFGADGTLYFGSNRPGGKGGSDLWQATPDGAGGFLEPVNLDHLNTAGSEESVAVTRDGSTAVLAAGEFGKEKLYASFKRNGVWSARVELSERINAPGSMSLSPTLSPDGSKLYFTSTRSQIVPAPRAAPSVPPDTLVHASRQAGNGLADIYGVDLATSLRPILQLTAPIGDAR